MPLKAPERHSCRKSAGVVDSGVMMSAREEREVNSVWAGRLLWCQWLGDDD